MEDREYYELPDILLEELECVLQNRAPDEAAAHNDAPAGTKPERMRAMASKLEAQFESYRRLGLHSVDVIADDGADSLDGLFCNAKGHLANAGKKHYLLRQQKPITTASHN